MTGEMMSLRALAEKAPDNSVAFGQSRVLLVWTRLIMPNGASIVLERQPGADSQARAVGEHNRARMGCDASRGPAPYRRDFQAAASGLLICNDGYIIIERWPLCPGSS